MASFRGIRLVLVLLPEQNGFSKTSTWAYHNLGLFLLRNGTTATQRLVLIFLKGCYSISCSNEIVDQHKLFEPILASQIFSIHLWPRRYHAANGCVFDIIYWATNSNDGDAWLEFNRIQKLFNTDLKRCIVLRGQYLKWSKFFKIVSCNSN